MVGSFTESGLVIGSVSQMWELEKVIAAVASAKAELLARGEKLKNALEARSLQFNFVDREDVIEMSRSFHPAPLSATGV